MSERRAHAVIDLAALQHNFLRVQQLSEGRDVIAVIKADAYGHGAVPVAHRLAASGCRRVAVVSVEEAAELREAGVRGEILVLGGISAGKEEHTQIMDACGEVDYSWDVGFGYDLSLSNFPASDLGFTSDQVSFSLSDSLTESSADHGHVHFDGFHHAPHCQLTPLQQTLSEKNDVSLT